MKIIDSGGGQIAIVVDETDLLLGVITDADLRKALLRDVDFQGPCSAIMTAAPLSLHMSSNNSERLEMMRGHHIAQIPIVDDGGHVVDVALLMEIVAPEPIPNPVVIMAGGLGSRLGQLTSNTPKPLLKVGKRPLLETIVHQLIDHGFHDFYISVNYRADMIIEHFGDGSRWGISIKYLIENKRLGTAGALSMLPKDINTDVVVMNGDILTKIDLRQMLAVHRSDQRSLTVAVKDYVHTVPYGVVKFDDDSGITAFEEKPDHRCFINAGIYVISPEAVHRIPTNQYYDMPSLFDVIKSEGRRISAFPIREYWLDIGVTKDFDLANRDYDSHFSN